MHHKLKFEDTKEDEYPVDYFVPNFGVDRDIGATQGHISAAENDLHHKLTFAERKEDEYPVDYPVPNFGMDRDIQAT